MKLAVFLPNWIGDVVMATPAIRALRQMVGDGELIGIMKPYVADVLEGLDWFDHQIFYSPKKNSQHTFSHALAHLRSLRPDTAVLLASSVRIKWMAWRSGAKSRVGVARDIGGLLLNQRVQHSKRHMLTVPQIDRFVDIVEHAGATVDSSEMQLGITAADEAAADAVWDQLQLPPGEQVVVFKSGGAYGGAKHWPTTHFAALASRLVNELGLHVLVNCGPAEREIAREIVKLADSPQVVGLAEFEVPLGLTKAVVGRSRLLVTTDSGPRFFGVAFERPTVSLFGPTSVAMTDTGSPFELPMSLELDCQPCIKRTCPLGHHQCMNGLTVDQVMSGVQQMLRLSDSAAA